MRAPAMGDLGVQAFYARPPLNTWLQNAGPFLVYVLPSWVCAGGLILGARRVRRGRARM